MRTGKIHRRKASLSITTPSLRIFTLRWRVPGISNPTSSSKKGSRSCNGSWPSFCMVWAKPMDRMVTMETTTVPEVRTRTWTAVDGKLMATQHLMATEETRVHGAVEAGRLRTDKRLMVTQARAAGVAERHRRSTCHGHLFGDDGYR
jgi:hypothetical protein